MINKNDDCITFRCVFMIQSVTENIYTLQQGDFFVKKKNGFVAKISDFVDKRIDICEEIFSHHVSSPDFVTGGA